MTLFTVDADLCIHDGTCAKECPAKVILMEEGVPVPGIGASALCIRCGHCVSICPVGAFSLKGFPSDSFIPVRKALLPTAEQVEHFLACRRSVRTYDKEPVDKDLLKKIIQMTSHAPSGHNSQPVQWRVVYDREELYRLSSIVVDWMFHSLEADTEISRALYLELVVAGWQYGLDTISREAPHLVIACGERSNPWAHEACIIAMSHFELALTSFGLGGCWSGYFRRAFAEWQPLRDAVGLGPETEAHAVMLAGKPVFEYKRIPPRKEPEILWI